MYKVLLLCVIFTSLYSGGNNPTVKSMQQNITPQEDLLNPDNHEEGTEILSKKERRIRNKREKKQAETASLGSVDKKEVTEPIEHPEVDHPTTLHRVQYYGNGGLGSILFLSGWKEDGIDTGVEVRCAALWSYYMHMSAIH